MNVLVVLFGGTDTNFLNQWSLPALKQAEWGNVVVDQLRDKRDVATQITAQLITGKTWQENGVGDRKRQFISYRNARVEALETRLLHRVSKGLPKRRGIYQALRWADLTEREFVHADLTVPCLFDLIPNSQAVYVPGYNPEPSWALGRNILDPRKYPALGVDGAVDLLEKNFAWRRKQFFGALEGPTRSLLMGQFQYIDSAQHLYLDYVTPPDEGAVEQAYERIDNFAREILDRAAGRYERVLFLSDNGAARKDGFKPTHYNRPFYSSNVEIGLDRPNIRDFFDLILTWTKEGRDDS